MKRAPILITVIAALALLSFALAACGGDDTSSAPDPTDVIAGQQPDIDPADIEPYPEDVKAEFLKSCTASSGGKKSFCECILQAYEDTLPLDMYQEINDPKPGTVPPPVPTATSDAANACAGGA